MDQQHVITATKQWISSIVIGLNLCPFAQRVFDSGKIRYVVSDAKDQNRLLDELAGELGLLQSTPIEEIETTLLIHPLVLEDFLDYNDFLDDAEQIIRTLNLRRTIQIASFHPHYQFAETQVDDVENYTNRSPYPMLHLLREESITRVAGDPDALEEIPQRNIKTLRIMGKEKILAMLAKITEK
jgi:hypothetical protein